MAISQGVREVVKSFPSEPVACVGEVCGGFRRAPAGSGGKKVVLTEGDKIDVSLQEDCVMRRASPGEVGSRSFDRTLDEPGVVEGDEGIRFGNPQTEAEVAVGGPGRVFAVDKREVGQLGYGGGLDLVGRSVDASESVAIDVGVMVSEIVQHPLGRVAVVMAFAAAVVGLRFGAFVDGDQSDASRIRIRKLQGAAEVRSDLQVGVVPAFANVIDNREKITAILR